MKDQSHKRIFYIIFKNITIIHIIKIEFDFIFFI